MSCIHPSERPPLGWFVPCLAVGDLAVSLAFYEALDLRRYGGDRAEGDVHAGEGIELARRDHLPEPGRRLVATYLSLVEDEARRGALALVGADVAVAATLLAERGIGVGEGVVGMPDGGGRLRLEDPDGRGVVLETSPGRARRESPISGVVEELLGE